jgi:predicted adenylyl cyclase CyaB
MEVELKHKYLNPDFSALKKRLAELGFVAGKTKHQIDTYYLRDGQPDSDTNFQIGEELAYLRLRHDVIAGTFSLDLKLINNDKHLGRFPEYEAALSDLRSLEEADKILHLLGYKKGAVIDKMREILHRGETEVALDTVANLGLFVEIEIMTSEADSVAALERVRALFAELGFTSDTWMPTGYVDLMAWKKMGRKF